MQQQQQQQQQQGLEAAGDCCCPRLNTLFEALLASLFLMPPIC